MSDGALESTGKVTTNCGPRYSRTAYRKPSGEQNFIYLDVGGSPFKALRQTVYSRPDSLIPKMLSACLVSGSKDCPLYIDRHPKTFKWILEVYRNGDIEGSMPQVSTEYLQRELYFYQLPSLEDLGLLSACYASAFTKEIAAKNLMQEIVKEIMESGAKDLFPWYAFVYNEIIDEMLATQRRVFVCPEGLDRYSFSPDCNCIDRCADSFSRVRQACGQDIIELKKAGTRLEIVFEDRKAFMLHLATDEMISLLKPEALQFGLVITARQWGFCKGDSSEKHPIFHLRWRD